MITATAVLATMVSPNQGRVVRAFGEEIIFHLDASHTDGKLTLWTEITAPGKGPPPHFHANEDEWFVVQEGRVEFFLNGDWREASPGTIVFMPRAVVHTFRNVGTTPSRMLVATAPSGFENFFERCAAEFNQPGGPNMDRVLQISAEHGIHFVEM